MSCKRLPRLVLLLLSALLAACRHAPPRPAVESIAILRFENLGSDRADDWMGRAFSEIISTEVGSAPGLYDVSAGRLHTIQTGFGTKPAMAPGVSAERTAAVAAGATRIAYGQYFVRNGVIQAQLALEDSLTGKVERIGPVSAPAAGIVQAASSLAARISPHTTPYGTQNAQVVEAHVKAFEGGETSANAADLEKAIAADPNFGPCYQQLAQFKLQQQDAAGALALLNQALARGNALGERDRARIQLQSAILRNDVPGRLEGLAAIAKTSPNDPQTWRDLAALAQATHRYQQAADAFRKATAIQPEDPDGWNFLGYALAYAGDLHGGVEALSQYRKLAPGSANPGDSLGDVYLIGGQLAEAEETYRQNAKAYPAFFGGLDFLKAAMARLMTGDIPGADTLAQQYFDARARDPLLEVRKAEWSWITGRRKPACQQLEKAADTAGEHARDVASRAYAELALWNLMLGNREPAAQWAQKSFALATPATVTEAAIARFLTQPPASAAEWEKRAGQIAPNPAQSAIRDAMLSYALLFSREFSAAAPVLQRMYDTGNQGAGDGLPVLLAWTGVETGRIDDAARLLRPNLPLSDTGLDWTTTMYFPRIDYLRGAVAQKQGNTAEAQKNFHLFEQLSGPDGLMWGEEQKAR